jgi:hypothetical protein
MVMALGNKQVLVNGQVQPRESVGSGPDWAGSTPRNWRIHRRRSDAGWLVRQWKVIAAGGGAMSVEAFVRAAGCDG